MLSSSSFSAILPPFTTGAIFGLALNSAGVASPSVIVNQMRLTDFHMLLAFLSASACSAVIIMLADRSGFVKLGYRKDSSYGWFGNYDANIIGGGLIGVGMAVTGACPGTVLVQMANGQGKGWAVGVGGLLGGLVWARVGGMLRRKEKEGSGKVEMHTVMHKTGLSMERTVLVYELLCLGMMVAAAYLPRSEWWLNPVQGGILIGIAQFMSVALMKKSLGVSGAYEDIGKWVWSFVDGTPAPGLSTAVFALGIMAGAGLAMPFLPQTANDVVNISNFAAVVGGFAMIFGARLAGGCTSGHGISGMSTMSLSSFITVAAMFGGGILAAALV